MLERLIGPLFGPEAARLLEIGAEELPSSQLISMVEDLIEAQDRLIGATFRAAMRSDRIQAVCPDTPDELLNPTQHAFRIGPKEEQDV